MDKEQKIIAFFILVFCCIASSYYLQVELGIMPENVSSIMFENVDVLLVLLIVCGVAYLIRRHRLQHGH